MLDRLPWTPAPETQPAREARARLTGTHRLIAIDRIAEILRQGEPTLFAFEGACRHGLRSTLCMRGFSWARADLQATQIVTTALHRIGAKRPSWAQGQPEWHEELIERTRCARCGKNIPTGRGSLNRIPVRFCSDLCGMAAHALKARRWGESLSKAGRMAAWAAQTEQTRTEREKPCKWCGKTFSPGYSFKRQFYCSVECGNAAGGKKLERRAKRKCLSCGHAFEAKPSSKTKYCSASCYHVGRERNQPERTCPVCSTIFRAHVPASKKVHCSRRCAGLVRRKLT